MKITNNCGLPDAIVSAITNDPYDAGDCDISVTRLIAPPRKVALEAKHADEITEDAADRIWSLFGQIAHGVMERANKSGTTVTEQRLFIKRQGWIISGALDSFDTATGTLRDFKTTSAYSVKNGTKDEWVAQLNILATMLREHGYVVKRLEIIAVLRDWSRTDMMRSPDYPRHAAVRIEIPLWSADDCELYIDGRVRAHQAARVELPECSASDRWEALPKWAVRKAKNKRATKLCDTEEEAKRIAADDSTMVVEFRRGKCNRCESYCSAAPFCAQWQEIKKQQESEDNA